MQTMHIILQQQYEHYVLLKGSGTENIIFHN